MANNKFSWSISFPRSKYADGQVALDNSTEKSIAEINALETSAAGQKNTMKPVAEDNSTVVTKNGLLSNSGNLITDDDRIDHNGDKTFTDFSYNGKTLTVIKIGDGGSH